MRIPNVNMKVRNPVDGMPTNPSILLIGAMSRTELTNGSCDQRSNGVIRDSADLHLHQRPLNRGAPASLHPSLGMFTTKSPGTTKSVRIMVMPAPNASAEIATRMEVVAKTLGHTRISVAYSKDSVHVPGLDIVASAQGFSLPHHIVAETPLANLTH